MFKGLKVFITIGMLIYSNALIQTKYVKRSFNTLSNHMDECIVGNISLGPVNTNLKSICLVACTNLERKGGEGCDGVQIKDDGKTCVFYSSVTASLTPGLVAGFDVFYYRTDLQKNGKVDIARGKSTAGTTVYSGYIGPESVVSGTTCNRGSNGCWCGKGNRRPLFIDLGQVYNIKRMLITGSQQWKKYSDNSNVHVGSAGTTADPIFGVFVEPKNSLTHEMFGDASGRYITIQNPYDDTLLCRVEVYEN